MGFYREFCNLVQALFMNSQNRALDDAVQPIDDRQKMPIEILQQCCDKSHLKEITRDALQRLSNSRASRCWLQSARAFILELRQVLAKMGETFCKNQVLM